jgi:hypothetical protein
VKEINQKDHTVLTSSVDGPKDYINLTEHTSGGEYAPLVSVRFDPWDERTARSGLKDGRHPGDKQRRCVLGIEDDKMRKKRRIKRPFEA